MTLLELEKKIGTVETIKVLQRSLTTTSPMGSGPTRLLKWYEQTETVIINTKHGGITVDPSLFETQMLIDTALAKLKLMKATS